MTKNEANIVSLFLFLSLAFPLSHTVVQTVETAAEPSLPTFSFPLLDDPQCSKTCLALSNRSFCSFYPLSFFLAIVLDFSSLGTINFHAFFMSYNRCDNAVSGFLVFWSSLQKLFLLLMLFFLLFHVSTCGKDNKSPEIKLALRVIVERCDVTAGTINRHNKTREEGKQGDFL